MRLQSGINRIRQAAANRKLRKQIDRVEKHLSEVGHELDPELRPVLFFNASTRIHRLSLNGAFSMLGAWGLRLRGANVKYVMCDWGMEQCILGTSWEHPSKAPPCRNCVRFSSMLLPYDKVIRLQRDHPAWAGLAEVPNVSLGELREFSFKGHRLGKLALPGLQWAMRKTDLEGSVAIRNLYKQYLRSAAFLALRFDEIFERLNPQALVVFNGIFYPEAVAREVAIRRGIRVITHEVGLRPYSAFFSHEHATFREVKIPDEFELSPSENQKLDEYLGSRFSGRFSMAGVEFWPEMQSLPEWLGDMIAEFKTVVVVFTNVIFDTSQIHANTVFEDMFAWLEGLRDVIQQHPDTLFIFRAHPDEDRYGKQSRESMAQWIRRGDLLSRGNVAFLDASEYVSSYDLIKRSSLVLVYNSSIGLEASIMGKPVVAAGKARYTQSETVYFPQTRPSHWSILEQLLQEEAPRPPPTFQLNARKLLYIELFQASLDLSRFLEPDPVLPGMVLFSEFDPHVLGTDRVLNSIHRGIVEKEPFILPRSEG